MSEELPQNLSLSQTRSSEYLLCVHGYVYVYVCVSLFFVSSEEDVCSSVLEKKVRRVSCLWRFVLWNWSTCKTSIYNTIFMEVCVYLTTEYGQFLTHSVNPYFFLLLLSGLAMVSCFFCLHRWVGLGRIG
jgi:hypothetical protein